MRSSPFPKARTLPLPAPLPPADIPIVAFDFGVKYNILRCLRRYGFKVQVVPATATAEEVLSYQPAGLFSPMALATRRPWIMP